MRDFWIFFLTKLHRWTGRELQREKLRRFFVSMARDRKAHLN